MHPLRTAALLLLLGSAASAADTFTQSPVVAPSVERGSAAPPPAAPDASWQTRFLAGPTPLWIWGKDDNTPYILRKEFAAPGVTAAKLRVTCDNWVRLTLNGKQVVDSDKWEEPVEADVTKLLKPEGNVLVAEVRNDGGPAGFVMKLVMTAKGEAKYVVSDTTWAAAEANAAAGAPARKVATYGDQPWGTVLDGTVAGPGAKVPANVFQVLPGFKVEKLFTVPKAELGSWVCLTADDKGRLIASDQEGKGLVLITPGKVGTDEPTRVER